MKLARLEPGDATPYLYGLQNIQVDGFDKPRLMFTFGVASGPFATFIVPAADPDCDFYYFAEKVGQFTRNQHTIHAAYNVFCRLVGEEPWHSFTPEELRWNDNWYDQVDSYWTD